MKLLCIVLTWSSDKDNAKERWGCSSVVLQFSSDGVSMHILALNTNLTQNTHMCKGGMEIFSQESLRPVSCTDSNVPARHRDIQGESPVHTYAEGISRSSSSWSLSSCVDDADYSLRDSVICEEQAPPLGWEQSEGSDLMCSTPLHSAQPIGPNGDAETPVPEDVSQIQACPGGTERPDSGGTCSRGPNPLRERRRRPRQRRELGRRRQEHRSKALHIYSRLQTEHEPVQTCTHSSCPSFEDFDFLAKYCIISPEKLATYKSAFEAVDTDSDGYLSCFQVLLALKEIIPPEILTEEEEIYVYRILELVDFRVTEGLTDLRLFAVVASLAQKISTLDDFMRSLISQMDFKSLEMKLYKAKQLFLFLLEGQTGGAVVPQGCISAEQLLVELKAGGIQEEHEQAVRCELRNLRSLDLLDFLAHLPLFILIHNSVITNPLHPHPQLHHHQPS